LPSEILLVLVVVGCFSVDLITSETLIIAFSIPTGK
jgi:hypothetical protein